MYPKGSGAASDSSSNDIFFGRLASLVATTIEHVVAPDVRYILPPYNDKHKCYVSLIYNFSLVNRCFMHILSGYVLTLGIVDKFHNLVSKIIHVKENNVIYNI